MTAKVTWGARLRYEFDKSMAAGTIALMGWLALVVAVLSIGSGLFIAATGIAPADGEPMSLAEDLWQATMRAMNAGPVAGDQGWTYRFVMLGVTLLGIVAFSALVGVLSAGVDSQLERLRKGRSKVLETNHTIILNWSSSIFDVISELVIANESQGKSQIVIMAEKDKVEMEDEIAAMVPRLGKTRIICRNGAPTDLTDLDIVSPQQSRSIIILSPDGDEPDAQVVKTILAIVHAPNRRIEPYRIAAEIRDGSNAELARVVGGDELQLVLADDLLSRIIVQTSRQLGLSAVFSELLDFEGCEFYAYPAGSLEGETFGNAIQAFNTSAVVGLSRPDGKVQLNPPMDTVIQPGQLLVLVAEDDSAIASGLTSSPTVDASVVKAAPSRAEAAERNLVLGWNRRGPTIVSELSRYLAPGSTLVVAASNPDLAEILESVTLADETIKLETRVIDTCSPTALEALAIETCDSVIVLGYSDELSAQTADTRTLITLLHLRKIADASGKHINIASEMADIRNRELAAVTRADDFVVSNKLISLMLAQASENPYISAIFEDLLDEAGSEICLRPIGDYVAIDAPVNFYTIVEAARVRGETAIGYCRSREGDPAGGSTGGVVINPRKSEALEYRPGDRVIVLALD